MAKKMGDTATVEMFEIRRGRGRPPKDRALTNAERTARYRDKKKQEETEIKKLTEMKNERSESMWEDGSEQEILDMMRNPWIEDETRESLWRAYGLRKGWL